MKRTVFLIFSVLFLSACGNPDLPPPSLMDDQPSEMDDAGIMGQVQSDDLGLPGVSFPEDERSEGTARFDQDDDDSEVDDRPKGPDFDQDDDDSEVSDRPQNFDQDDDDSEVSDRPEGQDFDQDDDDSEVSDRPQNFDQDDDELEGSSADLINRIRELEAENAALKAELEECQNSECIPEGFTKVDPGSITIDSDGSATFEGFSAAPEAEVPAISPQINVRGGMF